MLFGKYLNKYYLKYLWLFLLGIAALIIVDIASLQIPGQLEAVVAAFEKAETISWSGNDELVREVLQACLITFIMAVIMLLGRVAFRFCLFSASHRIEANLRQEMFIKAEKLPVSYYHENPVGNIMSWFTNDLEVITDFLGWGTVMLVDAVFMSTLALVYLFRCSYQLALIAIIPIALIAVWGFLVEGRMDKEWGLRQKAYDELYDYSQESFTGIRVIKAFVKENQQIFSFGKIARKNKDVNIRFVRMNTIFDVTIAIIINSVSAMILGFGGWFAYAAFTGTPVVLFGQDVLLSVSKLTAFTGYFDSLIWPLIALGQVVAMFSRSKASLRRISSFLAAKEEVTESENPIFLSNCKGEIVFNNFSFVYPDGTEKALDSINLTIKPGEKIGIVGKIGCGKTSLVNSLLRLYNVEPGSILIDGYDIMDLKISSLRDAIAYVPQDNFLYSDEVQNNISFGNKDVSADEVIHAAKFACVHDDIVGFSNGYGTVSGERGVTLSGGQKQRISIARAFIKHSPILILDDSVSAVDVKTEETILKNISEERKDMTTLVIASRISTVSHLDKIIVLNDGKLEAFDTHENLLKISKTYANMHMLQELEREEGGAK